MILGWVETEFVSPSKTTNKHCTYNLFNCSPVRIELCKQYWSFFLNNEILFATRNCSEYSLFVVDKQRGKEEIFLFLRVF